MEKHQSIERCYRLNKRLLPRYRSLTVDEPQLHMASIRNKDLSTTLSRLYQI